MIRLFITLYLVLGLRMNLNIWVNLLLSLPALTEPLKENSLDLIVLVDTVINFLLLVLLRNLIIHLFDN